MFRGCWSPGSIGLVLSAVALAAGSRAGAQNPDALSPYFEGKQVVVKMDMPASQKGVDIYPGRPQPLDLKSYSNRMKDFGAALQRGDSTMVTKVKVLKDNIEFQLGGGGYGTVRDNTDDSVHFTPADKSDREKELENQLSNETDPDRRRSLQRELDYVRSERERRDRINRARAEDDADRRKQEIGAKRQQGGSRFNIHLDARKMGDSLTPQVVQAALAEYVVFPGDAPDASAGAHMAAPDAGGVDPALAARSSDQGPDPTHGLKKGMSRKQVEAMYGAATETHDHTESGMTITSCVFHGNDATVQADFVNDVLVKFSMSSY
jgi:hypothetical protein